MFQRLKNHIDSFSLPEDEKARQKLTEELKAVRLITYTDPSDRERGGEHIWQLFRHEMHVQGISLDQFHQELDRVVAEHKQKHLQIAKDILEIQCCLVQKWHERFRKAPLGAEALVSFFVDLLPFDEKFLTKLQRVLDHVSEVEFDEPLGRESYALVSLGVIVRKKLEKIKDKDFADELEKEAQEDKKKYSEFKKVLEAFHEHVVSPASPSSDEKVISVKAEPFVLSQIVQLARCIENKETQKCLSGLEVFSNECAKLKPKLTAVVTEILMEQGSELFAKLKKQSPRNWVDYIAALLFDQNTEIDLELAKEVREFFNEKSGFLNIMNHVQRVRELQVCLMDSSKKPKERFEAFRSCFTGKNKTKHLKEIRNAHYKELCLNKKDIVKEFQDNVETEMRKLQKKEGATPKGLLSHFANWRKPKSVSELADCKAVNSAELVPVSTNDSNGFAAFTLSSAVRKRSGSISH